ncbi:hypothetical protein ACN9MB_09180 [Dyella kyungheensis]|uniref:hypothetical protein n=1 Tax=Dyella kyungheensis TaxID=1242174 RepID=UPI003CE818F0
MSLLKIFSLIVLLGLGAALIDLGDDVMVWRSYLYSLFGDRPTADIAVVLGIGGLCAMVDWWENRKSSAKLRRGLESDPQFPASERRPY